MPLLSHDKLIEQYYEKVKDKYPGIDYAQFRIICRSPFEFFKSVIRTTRLPIILIKYLGKLIPSYRRVRKQLKFEKIFFDKGIITEEEYERRRNFLQNYLNDYKDESSQTEFINDIEGGEETD